MKTPEDEEFERIEAESGWRKKQIEQSEMCSNYGGFCKKEWVGLTDEEIEEGHKDSWVTKQAFESAVWWAEEKLRKKNT